MNGPDDVSRDRVPDLYLERFLLGELPEDEQGRIERLLELDPELRGRLEALKESEADIARRYPAPLMDDRIRERARSSGRARRAAGPRVGWLMPALAAAAVVLAVGVGVLISPDPGDGIRLKGGDAELVVFRKTAQGSERLEPGTRASAGDLLRVGYRAAGQTFGAIVSTDGNGNVTQHLPRSGGESATLEAGSTVLLDFSYELDDAPRWERFYLVTGDQPFALEPVRSAARAVATAGSAGAPPALPLPGDLEQSVFTLSKETVP